MVLEAFSKMIPSPLAHPGWSGVGVDPGAEGWGGLLPRDEGIWSPGMGGFGPQG